LKKLFKFIVFLSVVIFIVVFCIPQLMQFLYPRPYEEQVKQLSAEYALDEALIYAVIRTESGFDEQAQSTAGAQGLMQLMPATAEWIAKKADLGEVEGRLFEPLLNMRLGCWYLVWLRNYYQGDMRQALIAYNAGLSNVDGWIEMGYSFDNLPFKETTDFFHRIQTSQKIYIYLYYNK